MARVKLQLPSPYVFETIIPVRITDLNYGNHLGNDSLVSILHESRIQWLKQLGYSELNIENTGVIMSDLAVEYKNESFYGDMLTIKIAVGEITAISFELFYHVFNQDNKEIAKAKTGIVCFDYQLKKITTIPAKFLSLIQRSY